MNWSPECRPCVPSIVEPSETVSPQRRRVERPRLTVNREDRPRQARTKCSSRPAIATSDMRLWLNLALRTRRHRRFFGPHIISRRRELLRGSRERSENLFERDGNHDPRSENGTRRCRFKQVRACRSVPCPSAPFRSPPFRSTPGRPSLSSPIRAVPIRSTPRLPWVSGGTDPSRVCGIRREVKVRNDDQP